MIVGMLNSRMTLTGILTFVCYWVTVFMGVWVEPLETTQRLWHQGYTEVNVIGYAYFACDGPQLYHTKFTAKDPSGKVKSGVLCSGFMTDHEFEWEDETLQYKVIQATKTVLSKQPEPVQQGTPTSTP